MNDLFYRDLRKTPLMLLGFIFLSFGMILTKKSGLGMSSWGVLHEGASLRTIFTFGEVTLILGLIILVFSVYFLKTKVGIGTISNVILIGFLLDFFDYVLDFSPSTYAIQGIVFIIGLLLMTFGRSLYISTKLGAGPRDGIFVGLSRLTQIDVKYIKPAVEFTVLLTGFLLGGVVGVGTLIAIVTSGYLVQFFFKILGFNPKIENQRNFREYLLQPKKTL